MESISAGRCGMRKIHTVLGEIAPDTLGFTQCHEHIMLSKGQSYRRNKDLWFDDLELSVKEAADYRKAGGRAFVEAQPVGCNRVSEALPEISKRAEVHIIASTGFHKMEFYPDAHWIHSIGHKELTEIFICELTRGMYAGMDHGFPCTEKNFRLESRAGIIKTALDKCSLDSVYTKLFAAAAAAQRETGAPLMVHIEKGGRPLELADYLVRQGVETDKVYFCHMDRACPDKGILKEVLDRGINLEFDTIGRLKYHSDEEEIELMKFVLDGGYEDKLLFSLDTTRARLKSYNPQAVGLAYIQKVFLRKMREAGITEKQIEKVSIKNPQRILAW